MKTPREEVGHREEGSNPANVSDNISLYLVSPKKILSAIVGNKFKNSTISLSKTHLNDVAVVGEKAFVVGFDKIIYEIDFSMGTQEPKDVVLPIQ